MHLIRSGEISGFASLTRRLGGDPVQLMRASGLTPAQFRDERAMISFPRIAELLERAALACETPLFGLLLGRQQNPGAVSDLLVSVSSADTVQEALRLFDKHIYLHAGGARLTTYASEPFDRVEVEFDLRTPLGLSQLLQLGVGHMGNVIGNLAAGCGRALVIHLRQERPAFEAWPESLRGLRVSFESFFNGVELPKNLLRSPPQLDQSALRSISRELLRQRQERHVPDLPGRVREQIAQRLSAGECSVAEVAGALGLNPRVLQTRLQSEGVSYRQLLRETRMAVAEQHLRLGALPITELALHLGYADPAVFSREFKKWTGLAPRVWRNARLRS